ncbi:MAG: UMP kinase [Syntrophales bacterium]|nr:UMP kinase [Syntrophales bacterium]
MTGKARYGRILLKLSGEALLGEKVFGIDPKVLAFIADEVASVKDLDVEIGIVIGGGNIYRGVEMASHGIDRAAADYMGMLATVMNSIALHNTFENHGISARVQSSIEMMKVAEPFVRERAIKHLEQGRVVIFAGGTGNPYFTTDTAAALRALEIRANVLLKATKVDGVYDKDPLLHSDARMFNTVTYTEALARNLRVMDATAVSLCRENNLPIIVFNLEKTGNIRNVACGKSVGTRVVEEQ